MPAYRKWLTTVLPISAFSALHCPMVKLLFETQCFAAGPYPARDFLHEAVSFIMAFWLCTLIGKSLDFNGTWRPVLGVLKHPLQYVWYSLHEREKLRTLQLERS